MRFGEMIANTVALVFLTCFVLGFFYVFGQPLWREGSVRMVLVPRRAST